MAVGILDIAPYMMQNVREVIQSARTIEIASLSKLVQPDLGLGISVDLRPFLDRLEERGEIVRWVDGHRHWYRWLVGDDLEEIERVGREQFLENVKERRRE
jgi:hypothetical protein